MNYSLNLKVKYSDELKELFNSFNENNDRVKVNLLKKNDDLIFNIEAKDSIVLRSVFNSITKLLTVYEKLEHVGKKDGKYK